MQSIFSRKHDYDWIRSIKFLFLTFINVCWVHSFIFKFNNLIVLLLSLSDVYPGIEKSFSDLVVPWATTVLRLVAQLVVLYTKVPTLVAQ